MKKNKSLGYGYITNEQSLEEFFYGYFDDYCNYLWKTRKRAIKEIKKDIKDGYLDSKCKIKIIEVVVRIDDSWNNRR